MPPSCVLNSTFFTSTRFFNTATSSKVSNPLPKLFTARYNRNHTPSHRASLILADQYHPLYYRTKARYLAYPRDTLWVRISCDNLLHLKKVVRSYCENRLKRAIKQALREAGFDSKGRALKETDASSHKVAGLVGTFDLLGCKDLLGADSGAIKEQARSAVEKVIASYAKSLDQGESISKSEKKILQRVAHKSRTKSLHWQK